MPHSASPLTAHPTGRDEHPASDEQLLTAVRAGDSAAFGQLYERHRGAALAVARMHSRNEQDAQDLVSEAFTRVLGLLREGKGPREFLRAYLVTAVSRLAADRANDLTRTRPEDPQPYGPLDRVELFDDSVVRQVDSAVVARAFASLPERWQEILWYLEIEGRRPRQVADVVGARPNTVSALGKRAREGLREAYMQEHVSAQALADCREYSSQLGAFARGSLTPSRTKVVQEHLDTCRRCTAEYLQLQDLGLGLRGWILPVLAGLPLWGAEGSHLATTLAGTPLLGASAAGAGGAAAAGETAAHSASRAAQEGSTAVGSSAGATASAGGLAALATSGTGLAIGAVAVLVAAVAAVGIVATTNSQDVSDISVAAEPTAGPEAQQGARGSTPAASGADRRDDAPAAVPRGPQPPGAAGNGGAQEGEGQVPQDGAAQDPAVAEEPTVAPSLPILIDPPGESGGGQVPLVPVAPEPQPETTVDPGTGATGVEPTPGQSTDPEPSGEPQVTVGPLPDPSPENPQPSPTPTPCTVTVGPDGINLCLPW